MNKTLEKLTDVIVDSLGVTPEQVKPEAIIDDLGADSLDLVELQILVEEEFGLMIDDEEAEKVKTVGDAVALIDRLSNERNNDE